MDYIPAKGLKYLFIDFNAFFAAVAQQDEPALRGKPVLISPLKSEHSGAIAASYEARAFGIGRGTSIREARKLCPDIIIRPARHDRYVEIHHQLMGVIKTVLPIAKTYSVDEAAFYLSASEGEAPAALATAKRVKEAIAAEVGPALRSSIGVAQTRLLGKIAAGLNKPDGLTALHTDELPDRLAGLPLSNIPGIGAGIALRLAQNGVHDFPSLWRLAPKHARKIWGSVQGERFWYALHGFEVAELEQNRSMFGHSRVLGGPHRWPDEARLVARALLLKAASRLRLDEMMASKLSLMIKLRPEARWEGGAAFHPSQDSYIFLQHLNQQWDQFLTAWEGELSRQPLRGVSVFLHGLRAQDDPRVLQRDLFSAPQRYRQDQKKSRLWATIDDINMDKDGRFAKLALDGGKQRRQGSTAPKHVMLAAQQQVDLDYLGVKIAFGRVPSEKEFLT
ncbi:MAG: hypothetical protein AAF603_04290 [Pseudomonadota bacterium]